MTREQANAALAKIRKMRESADAKRKTTLSAARRLVPVLFRHPDLYRDWVPLDDLSRRFHRNTPRGVMARRAGMVLREIGALKTKGRADKPVWTLVKLP